ncbi:MAG: hypothetical protein ACNA8R_00790 [Nitriliruptoraceae bacterium]
MSSADLLSDADIEAIRHGVLRACLHGTDELEVDTPEGALRLVATTSVASAHADRLLDDAVAGARHAGHSWAAVGEVLGVTRQAAQQRFTGRTETVEPVTSQQRVIRRVTALNEMAVLEREQVDGWHLVGSGVGKLVVEASEHAWEHQRLTFASHALLRTMEQDGWQLVGVWGWWTYLKRPAPGLEHGAATASR